MIDPWLEGIEIEVFREATMWDFVPQGVGMSGTSSSSFLMEYRGNVHHSTPWM